MALIVDLHIHSHYSRATSKNSTLEGLYFWGKLKGITIIGTGDFTHPEWFAELQEKLEPAEPGLWQLKPALAHPIDAQLPQSVRDNLIRFIPTVEISTIYSKGGKVRKLHQLLVAPNFSAVAAINTQLGRIGNLHADGRPILGLDSKKLLGMTLATDPSMLYIPAHIWTPWFGMHGSKSGFDSIEEAYGELSPEIRAVETGLSSDPFMNWRVGHLADIAITSHSDAHSPQKLGREATLIAANLSYDDIIGAIKTNDERMVGTIEFFPQTGKYHHDGHREHGVRLTPKQTREHHGICPSCGKPVTIGVDYRVSELASETETYRPKNHKTVAYIIPLIEILAELKGQGTAAKGVIEAYHKAIAALGHEFSILRSLPVATINEAGYPELANAIGRMRQGDVHIEPGYDGVFGTVKLLKKAWRV